MVRSREPQWLPLGQTQDDSSEHPLTTVDNIYYAGLKQFEIFRAILNLNNQNIVRPHPLEPDIIMSFTSPTNRHSSPRYVHHTDMPAEAVEFTKLDQQAYLESKRKGVLFLTSDGRIVPSESTLDIQPPHPEPGNPLMINDRALRNHYDGPDLTRRMIPEIREHHRYLDQMDIDSEDEITGGKPHITTKMKNPNTLQQR